MRYLIILLATFLSACTSLSKGVQLVTEGNSTSEVLVYRTGAFQAGAVSMYFGENNKYFVKLRNNQFSQFKINSGEHIFQAKADASPSSTLNVNLPENTLTCLHVEPNPDMLGAVIVPIVANMVPTFVLKSVDCPNFEELKKYQKVFNS
ncbi:hypothetical protein J7384_16900 [Endozoicomonas sp. G2_1]|uniref:hypothetical protein n=1 Tax=Endozoicomonas sp. G2_1 TaxID=2821091 RepID=UPI001AD966BF|nr:hypothetical protein [Endozoicomonas sp. G2_1]MBO9492042.1 hypothetical protein [Endozoicomonas sp. G2_1]